jgi:hypothetical protein
LKSNATAEHSKYSFTAFQQALRIPSRGISPPL